MIVIANDYKNKAVWNVLKMHIDFLEELGEKITILIPKEYLSDIKKENLSYNIIPCSSVFEEIKLLYKTDDKKIFAPDILGVLYSLFAKLKKKKIFYWMQGSTPEESYMKHKSKLKYHILNLLERLALNFSDGYIFVSSYMREFIEKKYNKSFEPCIIVPCISDIKYKGKEKEKNSFVYAGGMSVWQRVDKMLLLFNEIKKQKSDAKFYIATREKEKAKDLILKYLEPKFQNSVILTFIESREEMEDFLSTKEFGFLIRDDDIVNYVSSPIKLAEYLSCGVNVLISPSIKSYAPLIEKYKAGVVIKNSKSLKDLEANIDGSLKLYKDVFSKEKQINAYKELLEKSNRYKYLIIGPKFKRKIFGGTPVLVEQMLNYMNKKGFDYYFISTLHFGEGKTILNFLYTIFKFLQYLPKSDIVIVNVSQNGAYYFSPVALFFTKLFKKRFVFRRFGGNCLELYKKAKGFRKRLIEYVFKNADIMFFEPKFIVDFFLKRRENVFSLPNSREEPKIKRDLKKPYSKRFIFLGHIYKEKGINEILEASKYLDESYSIEIYGSLNYGDYKKEDFEKYPNVKYKGLIDHSLVYEKLSQNDVLILPSYKEGYPGVIIEAFAVGLPVIATNIDSIKEMLDSSCGVLIEPKCSKALADAMKFFNKQNYQAFAKASREKFKEYELNSVHQRMFKICEGGLK